MRIRSILGIALAFLAGSSLLAWTGCSGNDHATHDHGEKSAAASSEKNSSPESAAKPYPLKTCVVSGEELGKMGDTKRIVFEGQEIKFCCPSCEKDFRMEPAKFLKKIDEARKGS